MNWKKGTIVSLSDQFVRIQKDEWDIFYPIESFFAYSSCEYVEENSVEVRKSSGRNPKVGDRVYYWDNGLGQTFWMFQPDQVPSQTYWKVKLAIPSGAKITTEVISDCFRRMAHKCHSDRGGNDRLMKELLKAREDALESISRR